MNELEEIKNRIDIAELIGGYVQLKKAGRNFKGCCPFHSEKTPSFVVSPERQIWHCFGACNEGGDAFTFIQKIEGMDFPESLKFLADKTGVKLQRQSYEKSDIKTKIFTANETAVKYYQGVLVSDEGKAARDYLIKERKLSGRTIKDFGLGYSPTGKNSLQNDLKNQGASEDSIKKAGLSSIKQGETRDFFFRRLMFPIRDVSGRTLGFSARVLDDSLPKYINTSETLVYSKSNSLYGIDLAKESIRKLDYAIVAEGMMDVIASHQAGIKNIVATGGTALTENQLRMIGRFTKNIKFSFDIDFAGSKATRRAIELAWEMDFNIKVITLPEGKDPGDIAVSNPRKWKEAVKKSQYVIDYLFDEAFEKNNPKDALGRKEIAKDLLPVIRRILTEIEKDTYIKKLAKKLSVEESSIRSTLKNISIPKGERVKVVEKKEIKDQLIVLEKNVLGLLLLFPNYLDFAETIITPTDFTEENTSKIYRKMLEYSSKKGELTENGFLDSLGKEESELLNHYALSAEKDFEELDEEEKAEEIYFGVKRLKKLSLDKKKQSLSSKIERLEKAGNKKDARKVLLELKILLEEEQKIS